MDGRSASISAKCGQAALLVSILLSLVAACDDAESSRDGGSGTVDGARSAGDAKPEGAALPVPSDERAAAPTAGTPDSVVATVHGVDIERADFEQTLQHAERALTMGGRLAEGERARLADKILQKMIQDELFVQHARAIGLSVSDEEVDSRMNTLLEASGGRTAYLQFLATTGLDEARMRRNLRRNMLVERLMDRIRAEVKLDEKQLRAHYESHPEIYASTGGLELAQILFRDRADGGADAESRARKARAEIRSGLSWKEAVDRYTDDQAGKAQAGSLGTLRPADLLPEFAGAIASLKEGEVSEPVHSPAGVHLLRVVRRQAGPARSFEEAREEIQRELIEAEVKKRMDALARRLAQGGDIR
ncbi:MAG: SurA N-terminal domain-containing protein [Deltaproteobacteria bacterium]|nr:SurA N-terminal domain-containing protein [Deltaproteobacteria bacterium]